MYKFLSAVLIVLIQGTAAQAEEIKQSEPEQDAIQQVIDQAHANDVKVILDITRGVQQAKIIVNGEVVETHKIAGAKNKAHTVKGERFCAFTTTGTDIKPTHIYRKYYSREHEVDLAHFVTFDYGRGIGAHQGDVSGRSSGCIRQTAKGAKKLYDIVMENSVVPKGSSKIQSTNVRFDVIDNTPGRYTSECNCLKNFMRDTKSARAQRVCALAAQEPAQDKAKAEVVGASEKPAAKPKPKATAKTPTKPKKKTIQDLIREGTGGLY